jgi:serine/threonine protein kinase/tetratricopeptide (TPR) repeat protein
VIPETLAHYRILRLLGRGGMGEVYLAKDSRLDRTVALKVLAGHVAADPERRQRFDREAKAIAALNHPNIVTIHSVEEDQGVVFLTMELVEGTTLGELITPGGMALGTLLKLAIPLADAVGAAHQRGITHRDLKPANVMVTADERVKVLDFGLAKLQDDLASLEQTATLEATGEGRIVGTVAYMAPEQAEGKRVDHRSDVFALGTVLFEMATGQRPFTGDTSVSVLSAIIKDTPKSVTDLRGDLPRELAKIVRRCLQKNPDERYQTAKDLRNDLRNLQEELASGEITAPVSHPERVVTTGGSRKWITVVLLAVIVAAGAFVLYRTVVAPGAARVSSATASVQVAESVSLAILPFRNISGDRSIDWLGSSMAETLATTIGQSSALKTVSAGRVAQLLSDMRISPDAALDPSALNQVAQLSGADVVMWGQFVKVGDEIRMDASLRDVKHQRTIPLKAEAANERQIVGAIQHLATSVRNNLALSDAAVKQLAAASFKPSTTDVEALRYYIEGIELGRQSRELEALKKFQASTQKDSTFALAYSKLAATYAALGYAGEAAKVSRQAVTLAESLPQTEKYYVLANRALAVWDQQKAIEYYEKLEAMLPNNDDVLLALANLHADAGAYDKASSRFAKLLERDATCLAVLLGTARVRIESGKADEALEFLNRALTVSIQRGNDEARADALRFLGSNYWVLNKPQDALRYFGEALQIYRRLDHTGGAAGTLTLMAGVLAEAGQSGDALKNYREALGLARQIGDKLRIGLIANDLGVFFASRGRYDEALPQYKEALQIHRELRNRSSEANALSNIGSVHVTLGNFEEGRTYLQQALVIRTNMNVPSETADTLHNLAEASLKTGDYQDAAATYLKALDLRRQVGDRRAIGFELYNLGSLFEYQGRYGAAVESKAEALKIYRELGDRDVWLPKVLASYGSALAQAGRFEQAQQVLTEALVVSRAMKRKDVIARIVTGQGDVLYYKGAYADARKAYQDALANAVRAKLPEEESAARLKLAKIAVRAGQSSPISAALKQLSSDAERRGLKFESVEYSLLAAAVEFRSKRYGPARQVLESAADQADRLGARALVAQAHHLLGLICTATGQTDEARRHTLTARQMLDAIRKDARDDQILQRSDLKPILENVTQ